MKFILLIISGLNITIIGKDRERVFGATPQFKSSPQNGSYKKTFWKYAADLQEKIHFKVFNFIGITLSQMFSPINLLNPVL